MPLLVQPAGASGYACLQGLTWERAELVAVLDGDTIDVRFADGRTERVRYIGVDTPERGDAGYLEATQANTAVLNASPTELYLARDVSDRDRFGRLLRYVVSAAGSLSHELMRQGWARTLTIPPDVRCADELVAIQREAQAAGRGVWTTQVAAEPLPTLRPADTASCHPSYPNVCIPPPPPDLDCRDIPFRRFAVLPPDPHGFDRDGNGVGCEQ